MRLKSQARFSGGDGAVMRCLYPTIVKALFAIVIPPVFKPKVLFMMLQIRPDGVAHFTPVRVAHNVPESLAHYAPVEVVHYAPVCSLLPTSGSLAMKMLQVPLRLYS